MVSSIAARNASSDPMSSTGTLGAFEVASMLLVMWAVAPVDGCRDDLGAPAGPSAHTPVDDQKPDYVRRPRTCSLLRSRPTSASRSLLCRLATGPTLPVTFSPVLFPCPRFSRQFHGHHHDL